MIMDQGGPCETMMYAVHMVLGALQAFTAIMVAWLSNRAKKRDQAEKKRNGHDSSER